MNYRLVPQRPEANQLVLQRSLTFQGLIPLLLRLIGIACILSGGGYAALTLPHLPPSWTCFMLSGGFLLSTLAQLFVEHRKLPSRFLFDNEQGVLSIESLTVERRTIQSKLPYSEIRDFQTRRQSTPDSGGRSINYIVEMLKKDGAFWCLYRSRTKEQADAFCASLKQDVQLRTAPTNEIPTSNHSIGQIRIESTDNKTCLRWRKRSALRNGVTCLLSVGTLGFALLGSRYMLPSSLREISAVVLTLVALFGLALFVFYVKRDNEIIVTDEELLYIPLQDEEANLVEPFAIELQHINTILFNFSLNHREPMLYILKEGETEALLKHKRGQDGVGPSRTLTRLLRNIHRIDTSELSFAEQLHLENALQDIILERSGHTVA